MKLTRKKAPGRLSRAIVALGARTGKKLTWIRDNKGAAGAARAKEINPAAEEYAGQLRLSERTTITVETERLLIVRSERRSSTTRSENRPPPVDDGGNQLVTTTHRKT